MTIFCQMVDNKGWKSVVLKTCKNYFLSLFKTLHKTFHYNKIKKNSNNKYEKKKKTIKLVFKFRIIQVFR